MVFDRAIDPLPRQRLNELDSSLPLVLYDVFYYSIQSANLLSGIRPAPGYAAPHLE